ncbi:hypothetical protein COU56_01820 [Candidatus Pacearchaeota archaeon CG10_big_fil_rev_8_21_14_0_10_31_9]|nr:MAG: hypothetical protein COU56_01820 [Candidatus Pacearchaeota archaeon CG10_big_fil_rev_8_21_14_0_10_31_9]PIZ82799.1 MAG: hypothetical protein COX97_02980 [Candidatus Pacearchaeota archaeon CG_4_10_14_0_2_um_filter_05_32_18]
MGKRKPLNLFEEDVRHGDLVRLTGNSELEAIGYFYKAIEKDAFFKYSPRGVHLTFSVNLDSGICRNVLSLGRGSLDCLGPASEYEVMRRNHNGDNYIR